jgi:3-dehydroquinate synthetase
MNNDKKNNDKKINLILLRKIGKTTEPGKFKMTIKEINSIFSKII